MSVTKRFQEYLDSKGVTVYKAERALGMSNGSLGKALERDKGFKSELIEKIILTYGIERTWLMSGEGEMLKSEKQQHQKNKKGVPVYNVDFTAGDITQFQDSQEKILGYIDFDGFRNCVGFVRVKGSSMYPDFVSGDYIGLERIENFKIIEYGQPFGIVTKSGQRLIKIIRVGKDDDNLILRSVNLKEFDDIRIHRDDIQELFKVHGPLRDQWQ